MGLICSPKIKKEFKIAIGIIRLFITASFSLDTFNEPIFQNKKPNPVEINPRNIKVNKFIEDNS